MDQELAGSCRPQALHQLGDALDEQQQAGQRDHAAQRPEDRLPGRGVRALVDRQRVEEIVDADPEQHDHGRQEEQDVAEGVDQALGAVGEALPQHVGAHVGALGQRVGRPQHEHRAERLGGGVQRPLGRLAEAVARDHLPGVGADQRDVEQAEDVRGVLGELVYPADRPEIGRCRRRHDSPPNSKQKVAQQSKARYAGAKRALAFVSTSCPASSGRPRSRRAGSRPSSSAR